MNNIHPRVLERLQQQLPEGALIQSITPTVGYAVVAYRRTAEGALIEGRVAKASIALHTQGNPLELEVEDGTTLNDALQALSERYNLFWVKGIDYPETDKVIKFTDLSGFEGTDARSNFVNYNLTIPGISVFWTGAALVRFFKKREKDEYGNNAPLTFCLSDQYVQSALTGKIFTGNGEVLTPTKDKITSAFAKKVVEHLKSGGITYTASDLTGGEIVDVVTDNFSGIVVLKPKKGPVLFLRYRSTGADVTIPAPTEADPE